ncbi:pre-B-cell leukemia homeobox interacting protein 1b isoform X4 [Chaetodon trifascialis]|uniref:pre-B-cell leukemia homeobox interacting protein 1b isoform X4 n=1 Tax=Chaetodon trifascialis TaxID=109706 RepID=UPI003994C249
MSGGSSANNSWTILTPEETVTETLRPLAVETEHHEDSVTSAAGSGENQPAGGAESAEVLPVEGHPISEEKTAELSGDTSTEQHTSMPTAITDAPVPTSLEGSSSFVPGSDAHSQSEGLPEGSVQSNPDPDSFSDSYTHITPSPDEPPSMLLSTETLGGSEFTHEEERHTQEGTLHPLNGEGLQQEVGDSDLSTTTTDIGKQADSPVDSQVGEERTEKIGEGGEPEVRRRRSLLAALERIGRTEEEEEGEEEFQLPQREEDSGFSVNKCILGAVILLGLGTIFFSESDYGTGELKDAELPGKQEWFNQDVPPPPVDADSTELLNKLAKGNQQISVLQAQLQAQKEELKVAKGQAAEGAKERLLWEEMEKENRTSEGAQAPVKHTTSPPSGQPEDSMQRTAGSIERQPRKPWDDQREKNKDMKRDKNYMDEKKDRKERDKSKWKEEEKKQRKDGGTTEWKKGKHEQGKFDKEKDKESKQKNEETKKWKEKDLKKEKASRGDEGKPWKDREGKKEWIEKRERKEWKEEKDWKKAKHDKVSEGKQWQSKEEKKDWKVGKDHGEKHKGREEWKGEKEWKNGKDDYKGSGREEKWERKDKKEKGEKKEWKKDSAWKSKNGKDQSKEGKWKGERKQWEESKNHGKGSKWKDERNKNEWKSKNDREDKEWKRNDERKQWKENEWKSKNGKDGKEWKRNDERKQWKENEWKSKNGKDDKEWKWNDERKQRKENEWKSKNGKDDKEWKRKDERKQWNENEWKSKNDREDKEWKRKDERKQWNENEWKSKNERKQWENKEEQWKRGGQKERKYNGDLNKDTSSSHQHKDEHRFTSNHGHEEEHLWGDRKPPHTHRRPSLEQPEYWVQQRERLQHNPKPPQHCNSLETCAQAEGLIPVPFPEFEAILQSYLAKAEEVGVDASKREELKKLATEFFKDGVFVHDQMSFQDFVEDLVDVLEDMVEGDGEEEDSAIEDEMEEFEREVLKKFSVPGAGDKEGRPKGEWRMESVRGRG